ncbi:hypothetical protein K469DRAFT_687002 [Zopfia rhizophila CBS 207.26]|uniref:Protein kinase domain-containing protein n=1 Tax=Zopfia rhizophila CBS 207.26 TaxID=1314779 RepID=A0A6A6E490_9PEZI|nr:hypothetical protein K469DRAFT_687002 [Zopfia rhizophila CBS 207.26]
MDGNYPVYHVKYPSGTIFLKAGRSGAIYTYLGYSTKLIKVPTTNLRLIQNIEIKKRVYNHLGNHPNIIPCLCINDYGIQLEHAEHGAIREYFAEGSAIDNKPFMVWTESGFKHPNDDENEHTMIRAELYALGSTIYEIITSSQPYGKIEEWIIY